MITVPSHYTEWFNQNMRVRCIRNITNKAADFDRIVTGESLTSVAKRLGETNWVTKQKFLKHYQVITKDRCFGKEICFLTKHISCRYFQFFQPVTTYYLVTISAKFFIIFFQMVERNREYMENEEYIFHRQGLEVIRYGIPEWGKADTKPKADGGVK